MDEVAGQNNMQNYIKKWQKNAIENSLFGHVLWLAADATSSSILIGLTTTKFSYSEYVEALLRKVVKARNVEKKIQSIQEPSLCE